MKSSIAIKQRLGRLPPTLQAIYKEVYDASLHGFEEEEQSITTAIFAWLLSANLLFTSKNFCLAAGWTVNDLDLTTEQMLHYSSQMVAYDIRRITLGSNTYPCGISSRAKKNTRRVIIMHRLHWAVCTH